MFKALLRISGEEVILLDRKWRERVDDLRLQDRSDALICQGCRFPVRVRAGQIKRPHFAHKQLQNCHYGRESPELLQARALLYRRLQDKFGDQVTVEKQLDPEYFRRPVDCWVERPKQPGRPKEAFAYWIFDRSPRTEVRDKLWAGFVKARARPQWLFTATMLREYQPTEDEVCEPGKERLYLSTCEREFMQKSFADEELVASVLTTGKSLHYLDTETEELISYRLLHRIHAPHLYEGVRRRTPLSDVLIAPKTGEFGHPGERERARELDEEKRRLEQTRKQREEQERIRQEQERVREAQLLQEWAQKRRRVPALGLAAVTRLLTATVDPLDPLDPLEPAPQAPVAGHTEAEAPCTFCGTRTRDWWYFDPVTQACKCNPCLKRGVY